MSEEDMFREFWRIFGNHARTINAKEGYDAPEQQAKMMEHKNLGRAMLNRVLPKNATVGDFFKMLNQRFSELDRIIEEAASQEASIDRFERIVAAMASMLLESTKKQDWLFEYSASFRRGLGLLAERPKCVVGTPSLQSALFTGNEKARVVAAVNTLFAVFSRVGQECCTGKSILRLPNLPDKWIEASNRHHPDKTKPITEDERKAIIADVLFDNQGDDLWAWDGSLFLFIQRFFCISELEDGTSVSDMANMPDIIRNTKIVDLLDSPEGKSCITSVLGALMAGSKSPELAIANARYVHNSILGSAVNQKVTEVKKSSSTLRKEILAIQQESRSLLSTLESQEYIAYCKKSKTPKKSERERLGKIELLKCNIAKCNANLARLDELDNERQEFEAMVPPPRDDAAARTPIVQRPCSKYRGKTLTRDNGQHIKVESDGCTFTCLAWMGGGLKPRSFTMPNASQIKFMDALLDRFESERWYKPATNKSQWGNKLFARGDAKDFLDAGYIINWESSIDERELGGKRGAIRLEMLTERA